ncbi:cytochrome P450 [Cylindrospermopsis raciborskii CHAB3438]|uniref:cytochrome P450 n=1 Tax=Cylindrospermopsis raciborskii TaxID=77022 RepID=UPI001F103FA0|nr:cytochrome P450 [Cylindrospermopsis raciborskii]MCH4905821.1 cytochrome P450 [Cylindrospermopsis raciborskii CHAB3438]MEB3146407.1 cytochrome P450 [Cylindrospermopsis raciborskii]
MKLPGESQTPRFLQRINWVFNPVQLMEKSAQAYGDFFTLKLSSQEPIVFISNPQAIQQIFTSPLENFEGVSNKLLKPLLGENSLLLIDGENHRRQRKLLIPPFHGERMKSYSEIITSITQEVIKQWEIGKPFSVRDFMQEISLRVILQAVFGLSAGERFNKLENLLRSLLELTGSPLRSMMTFFPILQIDLGTLSPWGRFLRQKETIYQILQSEITERRADISGNDILTLMMSSRDENGQPMTDIELRDELVTLLFAGHETTASALTWSLYWIHRLPSVKYKLLDELNNLLNNQKRGSVLDANKIYQLPYLNAVCQETLRIYPIAMITLPRMVKKQIRIMDHEFTPGTLLAPCIYLTHHRADIYDNPEEFDPERFLKRQYSQYEYIPFGGGNRRCIGMAFAMFEMKLVLATILSELNLSLVDNIKVKPLRRGVTLAPSAGKWLVATGKANLSTNIGRES